MPQFMLILNAAPGRFSELSPTEIQSIIEKYAAWTGKLADGRAMKVSLYASPCADGVSEARYPFSAEVVLPDSPPRMPWGAERNRVMIIDASNGVSPVTSISKLSPPPPRCAPLPPLSRRTLRSITRKGACCSKTSIGVLPRFDGNDSTE